MSSQSHSQSQLVELKKNLIYNSPHTSNDNTDTNMLSSTLSSQISRFQPSYYNDKYFNENTNMWDLSVKPSPYYSSVDKKYHFWDMKAKPEEWGFKDHLYSPHMEKYWHSARTHILQYRQMLLNQLTEIDHHLNTKRNTKTKHRQHNKMIQFKKGQYGIAFLPEECWNTARPVHIRTVYAKVLDTSRKFLTLQLIEVKKLPDGKYEMPIVHKIPKRDFSRIFDDELEKVMKEWLRLDIAISGTKTKDCCICLDKKHLDNIWFPVHTDSCNHNDVCKKCVFQMRENYKRGWGDEWKERTPCPLCRNEKFTTGFTDIVDVVEL